MKYKEQLTEAMTMLAQHKETIFLGQSVIWDGHSLFSTLEHVPMKKRREMPVAEDMQMGISTGLALTGFIPVSIYPRWDFLLLAANQLVNHLDKMKLSTNDAFCPKVIIRTSTGATKPLYSGLQHTQDHTDPFKQMLHTVEVIKLMEPEEIMPAYEKALNREDGRSTLLVEVGDFYNDK